MTKEMVFLLLLAIAVSIAAAVLKGGRGRKASGDIRAKKLLTEREQPMFFRLQQAFPNEVVLTQVAFSALLTAKDHADGFLLMRGGVLLCLVSALIGTLGMGYAGMVPSGELARVYLQWALGDLLGITSVTPTLLLLVAKGMRIGQLLPTDGAQ